MSPCQVKGTVAFAIRCSSGGSLFVFIKEFRCRAPPSELESLQISRIRRKRKMYYDLKESGLRIKKLRKKKS